MADKPYSVNLNQAGFASQPVQTLGASTVVFQFDDDVTWGNAVVRPQWTINLEDWTFVEGVKDMKTDRSGISLPVNGATHFRLRTQVADGTASEDAGFDARTA